MIIRWSSDDLRMTIRWSSDDHLLIRLKNITKTQGTSQPCKKRRWERSSAVFILKVFSNCKCNVRHEMVSRQKNSIQLRFQGHGTSQLSKSWKMSSWLSQRIFWNKPNIWSNCSLKTKKNICQKVKWICVVRYGMVFCILAMLHKRTKDSLRLNLFKAIFTFNKKNLKFLFLFSWITIQYHFPSVLQVWIIIQERSKTLRTMRRRVDDAAWGRQKAQMPCKE